MTPEQEHIFCQAAALGIACGLSHRYEWFNNANRALLHGPYDGICEKGAELLDAFIAFEKTTAGDDIEQKELDALNHTTYSVRVGAWYARQQR